MGKRGIFDAFQAASGAVESVLNAADKELQLKAQMEVQDAALKDMEAFNQFTLDMQNSNDWENYEKKWEDFRVKVYNDTSKGLSSPFARRVYDSQYKNEEMKQRLLVKSIANQKMRAQDFSKGLATIYNIALGDFYYDKEVIDEKGNKTVKTASDQKKEDMDKRFYNMYERGLLDDEHLELYMSDSYSKLMNHDMVTLGKNLVDSGASIEEVTSKLQEYKKEYVTKSGRIISSDAVKGKATEEVELYYYKQQKIRWDKNQQLVSPLLGNMYEALAKNDMNQALSISRQGYALINQLDAKYNNDAFSPQDREKYKNAFWIKGEKETSGGGGSRAKFTAGMNETDTANYYKFVMEHGWTVKNEDGEDVHVIPTYEELKALITGAYLKEEAEVIGYPKAMSKAQKVLSILAKDILKPPFASEGLANVSKNAENVIKDRFKQILGKNADLPENQELLADAQSQVLDQLVFYSQNTPRDQQSVSDAWDIVFTNSLAALEGKKFTIGGSKSNQQKAAIEIFKLLNKLPDSDGYGNSLQTVKVKEYTEQYRNYFVRQVGQIEGLTDADVVKKFNIDILENGEVIVRDKKTDRLHSQFSYTQDKDGNESFIRRKEGVNGEKYIDEHSPATYEKARKDARKKESKQLKTVIDLGKQNIYGYEGLTVKSSKEFQDYFNGLSEKDRELFTENLEALKQSGKWTENMSSAEWEKKIKADFEELKNNLSLFDNDTSVPMDIRKKIDTKNPYLKALYSKAFYNVKKSQGSSISWEKIKIECAKLVNENKKKKTSNKLGGLR